MSSHVIVFSHGKESGPWGSKIQTLADTANNKGYQVISVDYQGIDQPGDRVDKLIHSIPTHCQQLILVGSSMGAYVSIEASRQAPVQGLFLLAPAVYLEGYPNINPTHGAQHIEIVHGWNDTVVPVDNALHFARVNKAQCHILDDDHRLQSHLPVINQLFECFLDRLARH